jgi:hypothetical protein
MTKKYYVLPDDPIRTLADMLSYYIDSLEPDEEEEPPYIPEPLAPRNTELPIYEPGDGRVKRS